MDDRFVRTLPNDQRARLGLAKAHAARYDLRAARVRRKKIGEQKDEAKNGTKSFG